MAQPLHSKTSCRRWRDKPKRPLPPPAAVVVEDLLVPTVTALPEGSAALVLSAPDAPEKGRGDGGYAGVPLPPTRMWGWGRGNGYCGETCMQQALLRYGSYVSAERIRYAAGNNELLVGVHDKKAAKALRLAYDAFDTDAMREPQGEAFLQWALWHVRRGHHVTAGWYIFTDGGEDGYDHIMPIAGVATANGATNSDGAADATQPPQGKNKKGAVGPSVAELEAAVAAARDGSGARVTAVDFCDLAQAPQRRAARNDFTRDGTLLATRETACAKVAVEQCGVASPPATEAGYAYALPMEQGFGIAVTGNAGPPTERLVLRVARADDVASGRDNDGPAMWSEPDWGAEDALDEAPCRLAVSATAFGLTPGRAYALLRFDDPAHLPEKPSGGKGLFEGKKWRRQWRFTAPATETALWRFDDIASDGAYFYRLVPAT
uniref:Peptidase C39-like domain-containing protein n=1 Tax=Neobodo designis TaxID=312471 RepID=A0A7S1Q4P4_NEODS|mmetsp:Transcript_30798/g.95130  ORF Transcript_30798/g.95130 Transcript_30798/m.95130 type:complete len:434 (+) Transcript_30798:32-1333(+)